MERWAIKPRGHYPKDWDKISKDYKKSVDNTCEYCGKIHERSYDYSLTTHHLDGDKGNCRKWNLISLCSGYCHKEVQRRINIEQLVKEPNFDIYNIPEWLREKVRGYLEYIKEA